MADAAVDRSASAAAGQSGAESQGVVLPALPESQLNRPPTAPGRRVPAEDSERQVADDYFVLPKIDTATRSAEQAGQPPPPVPAVGSRVPGSKAPKQEDVPGDNSGLEGDSRGPRQRQEGAGKTGESGVGAVGPEDRSHTDSQFDDRVQQSPAARAAVPDPSEEGPAVGARAGQVPQEKKGAGARRGPLPTVKRAQEDNRQAAHARNYGAERSGVKDKVGKAGAETSGEPVGEMQAGEGHAVKPKNPTEETAEERLERIRTSNIRKDFSTKAGQEGLSRKEVEDMENATKGAGSPRRARPADQEFGNKTDFYGDLPDMMLDRAPRRGQMLVIPYGKVVGNDEGSIDHEPFEVKSHLRQTFLRFIEKAAPDLESKPPSALSVEAGDAAKNKDLNDLPEITVGSDEFPRGEHGEGRSKWYGMEGDRTPIIRLPLAGHTSRSDDTEFRLQPATAHGIDVGFERTMAHTSERQQGVQLSEKDLSQENYQNPSGGYIPSQPNRTKHSGSDGTRAQARAEVAVAAPIKLPRQEGFMVDRDKDEGIDEERIAAFRITAPRDQAITTNDEITEEQRLAHKHNQVLEGPGKLEDTDYDSLDMRPSELAIKIKEKRGAYAVPKDPGADERRDARPIPMDLQLKPPLFERQKGSGEDKMRSAYY